MIADVFPFPEHIFHTYIIKLFALTLYVYDVTTYSHLLSLTNTHTQITFHRSRCTAHQGYLTRIDAWKRFGAFLFYPFLPTFLRRRVDHSCGCIPHCCNFQNVDYLT